MKTITKEINIYKYNELNEEAQNRAISNYIEDLVMYTDFTSLDKRSNLYKAYKICELELKTPWFIGQYVWDYCKKDILKELKKWDYYENGGVFYE